MRELTFWSVPRKARNRTIASGEFCALVVELDSKRYHQLWVVGSAVAVNVRSIGSNRPDGPTVKAEMKRLRHDDLR